MSYLYTTTSMCRLWQDTTMWWQYWWFSPGAARLRSNCSQSSSTVWHLPAKHLWHTGLLLSLYIYLFYFFRKSEAYRWGFAKEKNYCQHQDLNLQCFSPESSGYTNRLPHLHAHWSYVHKHTRCILVLFIGSLNDCFCPVLFFSWQSEWLYLFLCFNYFFYCRSEWLLLCCAFSIGSLNDCFCSCLICLLAVWMIVFVFVLFVYWQSEWLYLFLWYLLIDSLNDQICSCAICLLAVWMIAFVPVLHLQAAFSQVLENIGLCPRIVPLSALCEKFGIQQYTPSPQFQVGSFITPDNVTDWLVHYDFFNTKFSPETYWWVSRSQEVGDGAEGWERKRGGVISNTTPTYLQNEFV